MSHWRDGYRWAGSHRVLTVHATDEDARALGISSGSTHIPWCALYRYFDSGGVLLYVGVTTFPGSRHQQHAKASTWWPYVHSWADEWFTSRREAEEAERVAYTTECPIFNKNGVPRDEQRRRRIWYREHRQTVVA